jgi:hypothetical protein
MSDPSYMLAQRIVPDLFWFSLVLAVILALTHRLRGFRGRTYLFHKRGH